MNIAISPIKTFGSSMLTQSMFAANAQYKKITAIVLLVLACFTALYIITRCLSAKMTNANNQITADPLEVLKEETDRLFRLENRLMGLEERLLEKVDQHYAIKTTVNALKRYASGLTDTNKPMGKFLFAGPAGFGKTQLARELAKEIYKGENHFVRINISEFGVGGKTEQELKEALKKDPNAVVLLDKIELADQDILLVLEQFLENESMEYHNNIFIVETNIGAKEIVDLFGDGASEEKIITSVENEVTRSISCELCDQLQIAFFPTLGEPCVNELMEKFAQEVLKKKGITIEWADDFIDSVLEGSNTLPAMVDVEYLQPAEFEKKVKNVVVDEIIELGARSGDILRVSVDENKVIVDKKEV